MRLVWILLFTGLALAEIGLPSVLEVDPGGFLSVPVVLPAETDALSVAVPPGFRLLSPPQVHGGRALVNLLVAPDQQAGTYTLRFSAMREGRLLEQAALVARVRPRVELGIAAPLGETVVDGSEVVYVLRVQNRGNSLDRVRVEVSSVLPAELRPETRRLAPGEVATFELRLRAEGYRLDTATVRVYSGLDPSYFRHAVITTRILPFAGADRLKGPAFHYKLNLVGRYAPGAGLGASLGLGLGGGLSDFVRAGTGLSIGKGVGGQATLYGDDWSLGYRYSGAWHRLEGELGPYAAYVTLGTDFDLARVAAGVAYDAAIGKFSLSYRPDLVRLRLSRAIALAPSLEARPSFGLEGPGLFGVALSPVVGLDLAYEPERLTAHAGLRWSRSGLGFHLLAASRRPGPLGFKLEGAAAPGVVVVKGRLSQRLGPAWRLYQRLGYENGFNVSLGARYRPLALPLLLGVEAGVSAGLPEGTLFASAEEGALSGYGRLGFRLRAPLRWTLGAAYRDGRFLLGGQLEGEQRPERARLSFGLRVAGFELKSEAGYAFTEGRWSGKGRLGYGLGNRASLALELGYDAGWRLGLVGRLVLRGGFSSPEPLVAAFGGRATGRLQGHVFHDANRNGRWDPGEVGVPAVQVVFGGVRATTDARGRFDLEAYPGTHEVQVSGADASLALLAPVKATLRQGKRTPLDLPLQTVTGVAGQAWYDENANGIWDDGEEPVIYARVVLDGPSPTQVWTDGRGGFQAGGLVPGAYALRLMAASLKQYHAPSSTLRVALAPGPLKRVRLSAVPVVRSVRRSLAAGDLTLKASLDRTIAPPGAEVPVRAKIGGNPEQVVLAYAGKKVEMRPAEGGWLGYVRVPDEAKGVLDVRVKAWRAGQAKEQRLLLVVRPGPLARLVLRPAFVSAGETIEVEAIFLRRVEGAVLRIGEASYTLDPAGPFRYRGRFIAARKPGQHAIELWAEGRRFAEGRYTVEASTARTP